MCELAYVCLSCRGEWAVDQSVMYHAERPLYYIDGPLVKSTYPRHASALRNSLHSFSLMRRSWSWRLIASRGLERARVTRCISLR